MMPQTRWHREPWMWFMLAIPLVAVGVGFLMLYLAMATDDGLVVDDYYKQGLAINRTLARDQQAVVYQLDGLLRLFPEKITLDLQQQAVSVLPAQLTLKLLHATRTGFDHTLTLDQITPGHYEQVFTTVLAAGDWYVQLEAVDWRLTGILKRPQQSQLHLTPVNP